MITAEAIETWRNPDGTFPDDIAELVTVSDPEKRRIVAEIATMVIEHSHYSEALRWLEDFATVAGSGLEDIGGSLCGVAGVGKSTLIKVFVDLRAGPFILKDGSEVRPILRVVTPSNTTKGSLFKAMLEALGATDLIGGSDNELRLVLHRQLDIQQVRVIILDEFTHVVEDRSDNFTKKVAREVKEILSERHASCVFAGTLELAKINDLYGQIARRSFGDHVLTPFAWDEGADSEEWTWILEDLAAVLPIKPDMALHEGDMPMLIHQATNGIIDYLMKFLARASLHAFDEHRHGDPQFPVSDMRLKGPSLWSAFERLRRGSTAPNPFERYRYSQRRRPRIIVPTFTMDSDVGDQEASGLRAGPRKHVETFRK